MTIEGSSLLSSCDYDPRTEEFTVTFKSGKQYTYRVPQPVVTEFLSAPSKGEFYNKRIKGNPDYSA